MEIETFHLTCRDCEAFGTSDDLDIARTVVRMHREEKGHDARIEVPVHEG